MSYFSTMSRTSAVMLGMTAALLLSACGGADEVAPSPEPSGSSAAMMTVAQCLQERGWPVEVYDDGYGVELPADQSDLYAADEEECTELYGEAPVDVSTITDEQFEMQYEAELDIRQCLSEHGITVSEPPSLQAYIESYRSGDGTPWSAYGDVDSEALGREGLEQLEAACPPQFFI